MLDSRFGCYAYGVGLAVAMLAGCSGAPSIAPNAATISGPESAATSRSWINPSVPGLRGSGD
jgi:hypothetical protein